MKNILQVCQFYNNGIFNIFIYITVYFDCQNMQKKANNIQEKLLGTNVSDINIEKFRDLTNYNKSKYQIQGRITIPLLKTITNKFSPEIMFTIVLPSHGISTIQALSQCSNIMTLNLSRNSIENLTPLANLKNLKIVNLADNSIANINCFQNAKQLVNLHLQGNMLKSQDSIDPLKSCDKLKNLHLQTLSGDLQNPICEAASYRNKTLDNLSHIKRLDGIPRDIELANGSQLKLGKKSTLKIELKNIGPFYTNKYPAATHFIAPVFPGEQPLKKSISSCKNSINELQMRLRAALAM